MSSKDNFTLMTFDSILMFVSHFRPQSSKALKSAKLFATICKNLHHKEESERTIAVERFAAIRPGGSSSGRSMLRSSLDFSLCSKFLYSAIDVEPKLLSSKLQWPIGKRPYSKCVVYFRNYGNKRFISLNHRIFIWLDRTLQEFDSESISLIWLSDYWMDSMFNTILNIYLNIKSILA